MECSTYRELRATYGQMPLAREIWETPDYEAWCNHFHDCDSCSDWELARRVVDRGFEPEAYPCVHIADQVTQRCDQHPDPHDCPDALVIRTASGEYGLPVRDGGTSIAEIHHCPWCGVALSKPLPK